MLKELLKFFAISRSLVKMFTFIVKFCTSLWEIFLVNVGLTVFENILSSVVKFVSRQKKGFRLFLRIMSKSKNNMRRKVSQLRIFFCTDISYNYIFELEILIGRNFIIISLFKNYAGLQQFYTSNNYRSKTCFTKDIVKKLTCTLDRIIKAHTKSLLRKIWCWWFCFKVI